MSDTAVVVLQRHLLYCSHLVAHAESTANAKRTVMGRWRGSQAKHVARLVAVFVAVVVILDALLGDRGLVAMLRVRRQYQALSDTVARQRAENARLREQARRLREDPGAIEELARRELGLIRPGERVFIVKDRKAPPPP
jgi:cell division protein FtsB